MPFAVTFSRANLGIKAPLVTVEADISSGLPQIIIVGLPETAVRESKDRVKSAIQSLGVRLPGKRITVNLSPADLPKTGGRYDVAIALAILAAMDVVPPERIAGCELLGELSLNAGIRSVDGVLPAAMQTAETGRVLIVPQSNNAEAALAHYRQSYCANDLAEIVAFLSRHISLTPVAPLLPGQRNCAQTLDEVRGQQLAKRALVISAAGAHNLLFLGPPGSGKTMLASRLTSLLPEMNTFQSLETASIQSVSKYTMDSARFGIRPFRVPHHTASSAALVGGGNPPRPGEISLAHNGVLFLDELPEFPRNVLEVLREPLESGRIILSRARYQIEYPARFQLVAAMNPCPCGYFGEPGNRCECSVERIQRYRTRVSGPLLDRIDLHVEVPALPPETLTDFRYTSDGNEQESALLLVDRASTEMQKRHGKPNAHLSNREVEDCCSLGPQHKLLLRRAMETLGLSARGYYKILKVARTIADLDAAREVSLTHLTEAIGFRQLDRLSNGALG